MTAPNRNGASQRATSPRRAIVLGKGTLAIKVAHWFAASREWELASVVPVVPEPTWTDSLTTWAEDNDVPYVASGHYDDLSAGDESWTVDLAVSVTYDRIIRAPFIDRCTQILNIHNSPLPKYRGVSPINWALKNREEMHGVTIHEITPGIDDGPIVSQLLYSIYPDVDEVRDVYNRALEYGWVLFQQTMPLLNKVEAVPQDEDGATYYNRKQDALLGDRRGFTRAESTSLVAASSDDTP
jgi:methionyl-tRNA formyltransferase